MAWAWPSNMHAASLACSTRHASLHHLHAQVDLRRSLGWWLLLSSWSSHERHRHCHSWKEFFSFCSGNGGRIARSLRSYLRLPRPDDRRSIPVTGSAVKAAVLCLLLTTNETDNEHHALAKSPSLFETSSQETNRRHPTPFPNTNEVEFMPATSLHDLLDSMHDTLSQLQIAAGRACDVIYSLIRVSSPWPILLAMLLTLGSQACSLQST